MEKSEISQKKVILALKGLIISFSKCEHFARLGHI